MRVWKRYVRRCLQMYSRDTAVEPLRPRHAVRSEVECRAGSSERIVVQCSSYDHLKDEYLR